MYSIMMLLAAILILPPTVSAQLYETRVPFGTVNVAPEQSAGLRYESLIGTRTFVRLSAYPPAHPGRRLSAPVGRLDLDLGARGTDFCTATLIAADLALTNHLAGTGDFNLARPLTRIRERSRLLAQLFPDQSPPPVRRDQPPPRSGGRAPSGRGEPPPRSTWTDPVSGVEFVWVPGGRFEMGCGPWAGDCSDDERPAHRVTVSGFWIGKYEVTQAEWRRVMGSNPSHFDKGDDYPVEQVSWNAVQSFIGRLNGRGNGTFRLPTAAEWEYACRSGGRPERFCGGDSVDAVAWYGRNSGGSTQPVGRKSANGLGLHDMSGNVWEWVEDCWHDNYDGAPTDGTAWTTGSCDRRVLRGGSWGLGPWSVRSALRLRLPPDIRNYVVGFRLSRTF